MIDVNNAAAAALPEPDAPPAVRQPAALAAIVQRQDYTLIDWVTILGKLLVLEMLNNAGMEGIARHKILKQASGSGFEVTFTDGRKEKFRFNAEKLMSTLDAMEQGDLPDQYIHSEDSPKGVLYHLCPRGEKKIMQFMKREKVASITALEPEAAIQR